MNRKFISYLYTLIFAIFCFNNITLAQNNYPVRVVSVINSPTPGFLEDFANPVKNPIRLSLQLQDLNLGNLNVYLKVNMQGPGVNIQSNEGASIVTLRLLPGTLNTVATPIMAQYFAANLLNAPPSVYSKALPTGLYTFTFEVYDATTRIKISDKIASPPVWIESSQPPVLVLPINNQETNVLPVQNVLFQWTPRHTQLNDVEYEFTLTELPVTNRGNIQNVFLSQPPLYKTTISTNSFLYSAKYPPLREGYTYAWRVQAKAKLGRESKVGVFTNSGISEIYSFLYANAMLAPNSLSASWGSDFKYLTVNWKGQDNHQQYALNITDSKGKTVKDITVAPSFSKSYTSQIAGLSPTEKYTYKVTANDVINRKASSSPQNVAANAANVVAQRLQTAIELKGALTWSYNDTEVNLPKENTLITSKTDTRKQDKIDWTNAKAAAKKYNLKEANVSFYGGNDNVKESLNDYKNNVSRMTLLETVKSDDKGEFKFKNVKIAQLKDLKYFYLYINYKNKALNPVFAKIKMEETASSNRNAGNFNLTANTFRYSPKLFDKKGKVSASTFEEVGLYRLKSIVEQEKALFENEGNANPRPELTYNKATYIKVTDFKESNIISLFGNSLFNDQFVLKLQEKGFNDQVFPVNIVNTNAISSSESFKITDVFQYLAPCPSIKGLVAFGNETKNRPLSAQQVSVFAVKESDLANKNITGSALLMSASWKTNVKTDTDGKYELDIPRDIVENINIKKIGILVTKPNGGQPEYKVIDKPKVSESHSFYFVTDGLAVMGYLKDQFDRPIAEALVSYPNNNSVRSNANGAFVLNIIDESDLKKEGKITVKAQDFKNASFEISKFEVINNLDLKDDGLAFYKAKVAVFSKANTLDIEVTEELFKDDFKKKNAKVVKLLTQKNMLMESLDKLVDLKTYTKSGFSKKYVSGAIEIGKDTKSITETGLKFFAKGRKISFTFRNKEGASTSYLEDSIEDYELPESTQNGKAIEIEFLLKEAVKIKGKVVAYDKDLKKIGGIAGVELSVEGGASKATSQEEGVFELLLEKELSSAFSNGDVVVFSKDGYNTEKLSIKGEKSRTLENDISIFQQDPSIPKFTHLQGFTVKIDKSINKGGGVFEISGSIDVSKLEGIFELEDGQKLTFKDIPVKEDKTDKKIKAGAVLAREDMRFDQTVLKLKLHKYAAVTLTGKPAISMTKVTTIGQFNKGKIVGTFAKLTPEKILGSQPEPYFAETLLQLSLPEEAKAVGLNSDVTETDKDKFAKAIKSLTETDKEKADKAEKAAEDKQKADEKADREKQLKELVGSTFPVFGSEGIELKANEPNAEFKLVFPKIDVVKEPGANVPDGFVPLSVGGSGGTTKLLIDPTSAVLSKKGISLKGELRLPIMAGAAFSDFLKLEKLVIANTAEMGLKEASFSKKSGNFAVIGVKGSFRFEVSKFQVFDNFKRFGFGGKLFTSKENHLIVNSMSIIEINGQKYPSIDMKFPEEGYKIKDLIFKSNKNQNIVLAYNVRDNAYQLDAGAILELKDANNYPTAKKIFPLEVQKLMINTNGAFMVSVKADVSIEMGPVKVNIRRLLFSKGKTMEWRDMNEYMLKDEKETKAFSSTSTFNDTNAALVKDKNTQADRNIGKTYQLTGKPKPDADVELDNDFVNWVFGFAGGVQIDKLKGAKVKSDVSFLLGDMGNGIEVKFNSIDIVIDAPTYKAAASIKLLTTGAKVGFEGSGEVETLTRKFGASLKFYQLENGIEFGASLVANTTIVTGPLTWSSIGGLIDINTATNKYTVGFLGSANPTGTSKDITDFRNIKITILFSTNDCGAKPVVDGTMDWYNKKELYCNVKVKLDFCRALVLATIDCDKEVIKGAMAKINATVFISTKSLFLAASIKATIFGTLLNGSAILGVNTDFNADPTVTPKEVKAYSNEIERKYLTNGSIVNGIFLKCRLNDAARSSGNYWIASYSFSYAREFNAQFAYNWTSNVFEVGVAAKISMSGRASLLGVSIGGGLDLWLNAKGGYNGSDGWFFEAGVGGRMELYLNNGYSYSCNSYGVKWCSQSIGYPYVCCFSWGRPWGKWSIRYVQVPYPCGFNAKVCISGQLKISYYQKRGGFKMSF